MPTYAMSKPPAAASRACRTGASLGPPMPSAAEAFRNERRETVLEIMPGQNTHDDIPKATSPGFGNAARCGARYRGTRRNLSSASAPAAVITSPRALA